MWHDPHSNAFLPSNTFPICIVVQFYVVSNTFPTSTINVILSLSTRDSNTENHKLKAPRQYGEISISPPIFRALSSQTSRWLKPKFVSHRFASLQFLPPKTGTLNFSSQFLSLPLEGLRNWDYAKHSSNGVSFLIFLNIKWTAEIQMKWRNHRALQREHIGHGCESRWSPENLFFAIAWIAIQPRWSHLHFIVCEFSPSLNMVILRSVILDNTLPRKLPHPSNFSVCPSGFSSSPQITDITHQIIISFLASQL